MNKKKLLPIPDFKSIEEEADFWDTHDSTDYKWENVPPDEFPDKLKSIYESSENDEEEIDLPEPVAAETIDRKTSDDYWEAKYKLTTIIPLLKNPIRKTFILNQWELNRYLEGYNEYAEFIVELRRIVEE